MKTTIARIMTLTVSLVEMTETRAAVEIIPTGGRNIYRLAVARAGLEHRIIGSTWDDRLCAFDTGGKHLWDAHWADSPSMSAAPIWTAMDGKRFSPPAPMARCGAFRSKARNCGATSRLRRCCKWPWPGWTASHRSSWLAAFHARFYCSRPAVRFCARSKRKGS